MALRHWSKECVARNIEVFMFTEDDFEICHMLVSVVSIHPGTANSRVTAAWSIGRAKVVGVHAYTIDYHQFSAYLYHRLPPVQCMLIP